MRFLFTLALLYVLYLLAKGIFGKTSSPAGRRREDQLRHEWEKQEPPRSQRLDYSKVKDADYRDL